MNGLNNYAQFRDGMILRDHLAEDRTRLANERSLLAYMRTFVGFFASGAGLIKLFEERFFVCAGFILLALSPLFLVVGLVKYYRMLRKLSSLDKRSLS